MSIYIAARDLAGLPFGTHQYLIIETNSNPHPSARLNDKLVRPKNLGNGKLGYVVGAHNRDNLSVIYFEKSDYEATQEYYDKNRISFFSSDFDTEVIKVNYSNTKIDEAIKLVFNLVDNYNINQSMDKIKYPTAGFGFNSNSWAQTIIELSGGTVVSDLDGIDISSDKRIPKTYFEPICPIERRPKIN